MGLKSILAASLIGFCSIAPASTRPEPTPAISVYPLDPCDTPEHWKPVGKRVSWNRRERQAMDDIVMNAGTSQTVMLGEIHSIDTLTTTVPYRIDNDFILEVLPRLKDRGYGYLAIELPRNPEDVFVVDRVIDLLIRYSEGGLAYRDLDSGERCMLDTYTSGWTDIIDKANELGMEIVRYDVKRRAISSLSEIGAFENLTEQIFDRKPDAKVVVFCGAKHAQEKRYAYGKEEVVPLGRLLEDYTCGKNFTVSFNPMISECDMVVDLSGWMDEL